MKNITATILTLAMLLGMTACNGGMNNAVTTGSTTVTTETEITTTVGEGLVPAVTTTETTETETTAPVTEEVMTSKVVEDFDAFLATIPVYEYSYEKSKHLDEFDNIGAAEYNKYAAGEDFDEYYAIRFTEYPDIAIIGRVVTEPSKETVYDQRVMDSVIRNGERHYLTENKRGPGFFAYITDDFVCITMAASGIGGAFYAYDGGSEHHIPSDIVNEGQLDYLYEKDGIMEYMIYSKKYAGMRHSNGPLAYGDLNADDHFYDKGTVQLIDGKIRYIADISYTIGEWFVADGGPKEKTGCNTLEEYQEYLRKEIESMIN